MHHTPVLTSMISIVAVISFHTGEQKMKFSSTINDLHDGQSDLPRICPGYGVS